MFSHHQFLAALAAIVGDSHVLTGDNDLQAYLREPRRIFNGAACAVVRPRSTPEVSAIVSLAADAGVKITPHGGGTGLVGGQTPVDVDPAIILSTRRMNAIRVVDPLSDVMVVEAGVILKQAQDAARDVGRLFPLSLAAEGSCTIGGNLATNAGGTSVLAYGNMRDLALGLEVVLADGRVWNGLNKLRKDNTGYDLKNIFIGSEGTLGIITAATLKLSPLPASRATAICGLRTLDAALLLLEKAKSCSSARLTAFEFMSRTALTFVLRHAHGAQDPLVSPHDWYVLVEFASQQQIGVDDELALLLGDAMEDGMIADAVIASSLNQRAAFWMLRESIAEAQDHEGGSIKHDVSTPVASVPAFIADANAAILKLAPDCRPVPFGHLGDGNVHYNIAQPAGGRRQDFLNRAPAMADIVHGLVRRYGGSISAEHGVGRLKRHILPQFKDPVGYDLMRALKNTLDPQSLFNPGAVL